MAPHLIDIGSFIAGYRLIRRIGRGGTGDVFEAHARGDRFALKLLRDLTEVGRQRFAREAVTPLDHPVVVPVLEAGETQRGVPFLVMPLVAGCTLAQSLDEEGPLPSHTAVRLLLPVIEALSAAHAAHIVHRDLKPENIMVEPTVNGTRARLLDFGIARDLVNDSRLTLGLIGTPAFMAPEQLAFDEAGPAVDQWGIGVTLYECVTGVLPFGRGPNSLQRAIREAALPFPRDGSMDGRLFALLARATRKRPEERFDNLAELGAALDAWLEEQPDEPPDSLLNRRTGTPPAKEAGPSLDEAIRRAFERKSS